MPDNNVRYHILQADVLGTPPFDHYYYDDPAYAAATAKRLSKEIGVKLIVKPVTNPLWRERESGRMMNGAYRPMPWAKGAWWNIHETQMVWKDHYPHPSIERPGFLAYTKSEEDGSIDKQTILRPGAYLKKYFTHVIRMYGLNERNIVEQFMLAHGPLDVKFAKTENEIISVYDNGPETCMVGRDWDGDGRNPVYIYAAGDLEVAYLGELDGATARTLVWPAKKLYSRVYGDIARLTAGLTRLGYKWGAPIGARVQKVQKKPVKFDPCDGYLQGCFISPYIDKLNQKGGGHLSIIEKDDHMVICKDGELGSHHCGLPDGVTGMYVPRADEYPTFTCEKCGVEGFRELNTIQSDPEDPEEYSWCQRCTIDHAFRCNWSNTLYPRFGVKRVEVDGYFWCQYYADMYAAKCDMTGYLSNKENLINVWINDQLKNVCHGWVENNGGVFTSVVSRRKYLRRDRVVVGRVGYGAMYVGRSELKHHAFECDECRQWTAIGDRYQSKNDDKLFCHTCHLKITGTEEKKPTASSGGYEIRSLLTDAYRPTF